MEEKCNSSKRLLGYLEGTLVCRTHKNTPTVGVVVSS